MERFKVIETSGYKIYDNERQEYWYCVFDYFTESKSDAIEDCKRMNNLYNNARDQVNRYNIYLESRRKRKRR